MLSPGVAQCSPAAGHSFGSRIKVRGCRRGGIQSNWRHQGCACRQRRTLVSVWAQLATHQAQAFDHGIAENITNVVLGLQKANSKPQMTETCRFGSPLLRLLSHFDRFVELRQELRTARGCQAGRSRHFGHLEGEQLYEFDRCPVV